jgi:excisionase family DNA binding protein
VKINSLSVLGAREGSVMEKLLNVREIAAYLGVTPGTIYKMTSVNADPAIPHIKLGGAVRFDRADIDTWLRKRKLNADLRDESWRKR